MMKLKRIAQVVLTLMFALVLAACAGSRQSESTGEYFDDTAVTSRVKTVLLDDPIVSGLAVNVETFKGTVQLSGFVKTAAERNRAVALARQVKGVRRVKNDLLIR